MKSRLVRTLAAGAILAATTQAAWSAEFEWKYFTIYDVADKQTEWGREFAKAVKDATGGRIEIKVFSGSELPYKGVDVYRALSRRQIEIGHSATGFVAQDLPLVNVMSMPFVCTDMRKFFDVALLVRNTLDPALFDKFKVRALMRWTMPGQQVGAPSRSRRPTSRD
jgi:TRAP-type C4-dicarboxylate transport system substrate-binding protein